MFTTTSDGQRPSLLILIILGGLFYVAGQYIASQPQRITQEQEARREIAVEGRGEVQARPDIAQLTLGVQTGPQPNAEAAMKLLSDRFNAVAASLKESGIKKEDIKTTNLSIQPIYDFRDGRQELRGFEASESVEVKIRDLDTIGEVLAKSTSEGVNQASGISFTIDDPASLQLEAQEAAIKDAQAKAEKLAKTLDVHLGRIKGFSSSQDTSPPPPFYTLDAQSARGSAEKTLPAPEVPTGSQEIVSRVTITYELR